MIPGKDMALVVYMAGVTPAASSYTMTTYGVAVIKIIPCSHNPRPPIRDVPGGTWEHGRGGLLSQTASNILQAEAVMYKVGPLKKKKKYVLINDRDLHFRPWAKRVNITFPDLVHNSRP